MRVGRQIDLSKAAIDPVKIRVVRRVVASVCDHKIEADKAVCRVKGFAHIRVAQHLWHNSIRPAITKVIERKLPREEIKEERRLADARREWRWRKRRR